MLLGRFQKSRRFDNNGNRSEWKLRRSEKTGSIVCQPRFSATTGEKNIQLFLRPSREKAISRCLVCVAKFLQTALLFEKHNCANFMSLGDFQAENILWVSSNVNS